jgi:hypothetical protein
MQNATDADRENISSAPLLIRLRQTSTWLMGAPAGIRSIRLKTYDFPQTSCKIRRHRKNHARTRSQRRNWASTPLPTVDDAVYSCVRLRRDDWL